MLVTPCLTQRTQHTQHTHDAHPRQDGNFSEEAFRDTLNAELANTVGNMLNRTLGLLHKYCSGVLPAGADEVRGAVLGQCRCGCKRHWAVVGPCCYGILDLLQQIMRLCRLKPNPPTLRPQVAPDASHPLRAAAAEGVDKVAAAYAALSPHTALEAVVAVASRGNLYLEETAPWTALKKVGCGSAQSVTCVCPQAVTSLVRVILG